MKNLFRLFILMLCCASAMSLTSCLNSDDNDSSYLDEASQLLYQQRMAGYYTGQILFYKQKTESSSSLDDNYKTISPTSWRVNSSVLRPDSTMTVSGTGIAEALASAFGLTNSSTKETYQKVVNALTNPLSTTATIRYAIPSAGAVSTSAINFSANMYVKAVVNYDNADHYIYFILTQLTGYYAGQWTSSTSMAMTFLLYNVWIADTDTGFSNLQQTNAVASNELRTIGMIITTQTTNSN